MFVRAFSALALFALPACATSEARGVGAKGMVSPAMWAEQCKPWDDWDKPAPPSKVHGNTYYVGTCGIAAILVVGKEGHVLIDTGTKTGAKTVIANVKSLGLDTQDIHFITHSHEHFDHIGGLWDVYETTSASVVSSYPAEAVISTGDADPRDPQFGMHEPMAPANVHLRVANGEKIRTLHQGQFDLTLTAIATPGHTPGALSWQWESCEDQNGSEVCKTIVYADSLSPVSSDDYKFSDHPEYLAAYRAGIDRLAKLDCDILLTPHPSHSKMIERAKTGSFEGGVTCAEYAAGKHRDLDARLERETGANQ